MLAMPPVAIEIVVVVGFECIWVLHTYSHRKELGEYCHMLCYFLFIFLEFFFYVFYICAILYILNSEQSVFNHIFSVKLSNSRKSVFLILFKSILGQERSDLKTQVTSYR